MNKKLRTLGFFLSLVIVVGVSVIGVKGLITSDIKEVNGYKPYTQETINEAKSILVQDKGRVKPFQSWASTYMLAMHGQRGMKVLVNGEKIKIPPTAWLLDVIFRPEEADKLPTFRVDNSNILASLGMTITASRDRYSLDDMKPYLEKLDEVNHAIRAKIKKSGRDSLTPEEKQTSDLFESISIYMSLRDPFTIHSNTAEVMQQIGVEKVSDVFGYQEKIIGFMKNGDKSALQLISGLDTLTTIFHTLSKQPQQYGKFSGLPLIPPSDPEEQVWLSAGKEYAKIASHNGDLFKEYTLNRDAVLKKFGQPTAQNGNALFKEYFPVLKSHLAKCLNYPEHVKKDVIAMETLSAGLNSGDATVQQKAIQAFKANYAGRVLLREEGTSAESEISYNDNNYFNNSLAFIILSLLVVIIRCMALGTELDKILYWLAYAIAAIATIYIITGITHRSIIMNRPPVGTLYDTMPFIVGASLLLLLLLELIGKDGILLAVATVLGIGGIVLAKQYEVSQATDNLSPLRAVLKSNYWLTTHVIIITLGYAGGLITAAISAFYILGRAFGIIDSKPLRRQLTGIAYGMVAFTLVFSLIGTILGGIWGADSWGRFWGWDPKENGALLIVLWVIIVLHARLGGYIREMGLHCCGVFTAAIVVFSWWHVNFLGVGLHSYGFTSADAMGALWIFYGVITFLVILGSLITIIEKNTTERNKLEKLASEETEIDTTNTSQTATSI